MHRIRTRLHAVAHRTCCANSGRAPTHTQFLGQAREVNVVTRSSREATSPSGGEWLTVGQVCAELKISPRTFYRWRTLGTGPRSKRMAKGGLRVRRSWLDEWLDEPEQDIA
jgi:predicted DNA-binding transcriptional regulator AlpA